MVVFLDVVFCGSWYSLTQSFMVIFLGTGLHLPLSLFRPVVVYVDVSFYLPLFRPVGVVFLDEGFPLVRTLFYILWWFS